MGKSQNGQGGEEASRSDAEAGKESESSGWRGTSEEFDFLRQSFRSSYQEGASEAPSREEVAAALRTLAAVISQMVAGAGNTLKDPAVKQQVQKTTRSVMFALAGVFSDWASVVRSRMENRARNQRDATTGREEAEEAAASKDAPSDQGGQDS